MTQIDDLQAYTNFEMPRRSTFLTSTLVGGYTGDPNDPGSPAILQNAPVGTWFLSDTGPTEWRKFAAGSTGWVQSAASSGGVSGPGSSTDNAISVFDGTGGSTIKEPDAPVDFKAQNITNVGSIAGHVPTTRAINNGTGISGGGDLSADRTLAVDQSALDPANQGSGAATLGQALLANGTGGAAWGDILTADRVGWLRIVDVTPTNPGDTVSAKVFDDPPGNTLLQSATSSSGDVTLLIEASFPRITIGVTTYTLPLIPTAGLYRDTIAITVAASGPVVAEAIDPDGDAAASDTVTLTLDLPPVITAAIFVGGYPGSQTELKEGDTYQLQVTADKAFDSVVISDYGAGQSSTIPVVAGLSATVGLTVADRGTTSQLLGARVAVLDAGTGASSATYDTDSAGSVDGINVLDLNNLYPTAVWGSPTYPGIQGALKGVETATVPVTLANLDTVLFDDDSTGELTVTNPTTIETPKTVTRAGGTYNVSTDNLRVSANRAANDATTEAKRNVAIANVAANVTVSPPAARLRSGGNDGTSVQNHTITLSADQELLSAPSLNEQATFGAFIGSWIGGPSTWTRTLQVADTNAKGVGTWQGLVATNLAGIAQNTVGTGSTYTLGGFVARNLTFAAFATTTTLNAEVVTFAKLTAGVFTATNQAAIKQAIGTSPPVTNGYTINSLAVNPTTLTWLDTAAASTNSTGTAQITAVEEIV